MRSLYKNKKGISEVVSYVLLVVIAISISVLAFVFLKDLIPKGEAPECAENVGLSIQEINCNVYSSGGQQFGNLSFKISNRGLFIVDGVYLRAAEESRITRDQLNSDSDFINRINPQSTMSFNFPSTNYVNSSKTYILEVQPAFYDSDKNLFAACKSVVSQRFTCSGVVGGPVVGNDPPEISISSPTNNQIVFSNNTIVNFTATDAENSIDSCRYELDGINKGEISCNLGDNSFTTSNYTYGIHSIEVFVKDDSNQEVSSTINISYPSPSSPPVLQIISPVQNQYTLSPVNVSLQASGTELDSCKYNFDSITNISYLCNSGLIYNFSQSLTPGQHTINYYANTTTGLSSHKNVSFNVTNTPQPACGDGLIQSPEQCDGTNLSGQTCQSQGFDSGSLSCSSSCTFDTSQCSNNPPQTIVQVYNCRELNQSNVEYSLQNDIINFSQQVCFSVNAEKFVFNGNGHLIDAVYNLSSNNKVFYNSVGATHRDIEIKNTRFSDAIYGINLWNNDGLKIINNSFEGKPNTFFFSGIRLSGVQNARVESNRFNNGRFGYAIIDDGAPGGVASNPSFNVYNSNYIYNITGAAMSILHSNNANITNNYVEKSGQGLWITSSTDILLSGNSITSSNQDGLTLSLEGQTKISAQNNYICNNGLSTLFNYYDVFCQLYSGSSTITGSGNTFTDYHNDPTRLCTSSWPIQGTHYNTC